MTGATERTSETVFLTHNRIRLALHELRRGKGRALLVLHGLGEQIPAQVPTELLPWKGPIWGLDFTGHGDSTVPAGGGYTCELLMADADVALAHLGAAALYGRGLGGYVGLLLAGARPTLVQGLIIGDGPGIAGGGTRPGALSIISVPPDEAGKAPDPFALAELSRDVRPTDYAAGFALEAVRNSSLEPAIAVCAFARPDWLRAVTEEYGVAVLTLDKALATFA